MNHTGAVIGENQCAICLSAMINQNSVMDTHGHRFCKRCIVDWLRINKTCPLSRQRLTISSLKPLNRDGELRELKHCKYMAYGCDKEFYDRGLKLHENQCRFLIEECTECAILLDYSTIQDHDCQLRGARGLTNGQRRIKKPVQAEQNFPCEDKFISFCMHLAIGFFLFIFVCYVFEKSSYWLKKTQRY